MLIRYGQLCKSCVGGKCREKSTEQQPYKIECPTCAGRGCRHCGEAGRIRLVGCPKEGLPRDLYQTFQLARLYRRGLPPVAGGVLDQTQWWLDTAEFIWDEESTVRKELKLRPLED